MKIRRLITSHWSFSPLLFPFSQVCHVFASLEMLQFQRCIRFMNSFWKFRFWARRKSTKLIYSMVFNFNFSICSLDFGQWWSIYRPLSTKSYQTKMLQTKRKNQAFYRGRKRRKKFQEIQWKGQWIIRERAVLSVQKWCNGHLKSDTKSSLFLVRTNFTLALFNFERMQQNNKSNHDGHTNGWTMWFENEMKYSKDFCKMQNVSSKIWMFAMASKLWIGTKRFITFFVHKRTMFDILNRLSQ